jgi:cation diffusion facilitator CzcD-associated flavoprotein CzcO
VVNAIDCDIAIVGAGPYGLAAASHLHAANGLAIRVFGEPMSFWDQQMPRGMLLRSPYVASNIADPERALTLDGFQADVHKELSPPVPLEAFVDYGRWFQQNAFPQLDPRQVARIDKNGAFELELADGEKVRAKRTIVAAGIFPFAFKPPQFREVPSELASHASEHRDLTSFAGKDVVVVGGGQSALESAALLHESGARVEILVRAPRIFFLRRAKGLSHRLGPVTKLVFDPAEVGPAGISRLVAAPNWYRRLPRRIQDRFSVRSLRPAGAAWLQPRLEQVPMSFSANVVSARESDGQVELKLGDGSSRRADHVLLATGYRVDIGAYSFLSSKLLQRIARVGGYPRLGRGFESSLTGLHFLGAPAAWSYGPLMRFVAGTEFTAPTLTRAVLGNRRRRR